MIAARLTASWASDPNHVSQSAYAAATPMLAAAGIVVTEIRTPISAPDFAVDSDSMPAAPAHAATKKEKKSGCEIRDAICESSLEKSCGASPVARKTSEASHAPVIASGKPAARATKERTASGRRR